MPFRCAVWCLQNGESSLIHKPKDLPSEGWMGLLSNDDFKALIQKPKVLEEHDEEKDETEKKEKQEQ